MYNLDYYRSLFVKDNVSMVSDGVYEGTKTYHSPALGRETTILIQWVIDDTRICRYQMTMDRKDVINWVEIKK